MKNKTFSLSHQLYLRKIKRENITVKTLRFSILIFGLLLWELLAYFNIIDSFITSCPSKIFATIFDLSVNNDLLYHVQITLFETLLGFIIAGVLGYLIALILWW